jgi:hypothetical protein
MKTLAIMLVGIAACADPVVDMKLVLPKSDTMSPQCITAVEVHANGTTYPSVQADQTRSCIEISAGNTYASVRDAIAGKFTLQVPESGLASLEVYGLSGPLPCSDDDTPFAAPNLLFFGSGDYIGQDTIDLPITPNLDCATEPVKVRMVDMFALMGGATCANAMMPDANAGVGLGTLAPRLHGKGVELFGNLDGGDLASSVASFTGHTHVGTRSCLAIDGGNNDAGSLGCVIGGTPVCAGAGELEAPYFSNAIADMAYDLDSVSSAQFPDVIIGSVWSNGATKAPVSGATVEVDTNHAKVVYVEPANGGTTFQIRDGATGPSGLFILYTDTLVLAKIHAGTSMRTVTLGAMDLTPAGAMIVMP